MSVLPTVLASKSGRRTRGSVVMSPVGAALVVLALAGCGASSKHGQGAAPATTASPSATSTTPTSLAATSGARTAGLGIGPSTSASTVPSPTSTPVPIPTSAPTGFGAFVGEWTFHGAVVVINPDGAGVANWRIYKWCSDDPTPPCDSVRGGDIIDGGKATFRLTSTKGTQAFGVVSATLDPGTVADGPLVIQLLPNDYLHFPKLTAPLCGPRAPVASCGA